MTGNKDVVRKNLSERLGHLMNLGFILREKEIIVVKNFIRENTIRYDF